MKDPWFSLVNDYLNLTRLFEVYSMSCLDTQISHETSLPSPSKQVILAGPRNMPQRYDTFAFLDAVVGRLQTLQAFKPPNQAWRIASTWRTAFPFLRWWFLGQGCWLTDSINWKLWVMAHGGEYFKHLRYMKWLQNLGPIVDTLKMNRDE